MKKLFSLTLMAILASFASYAALTITGPTSVCAGSMIVDSASTSGGVWTSSSTAIATVGSSTGYVYGITPGVVTITYTLGTYAVYSITVNPSPAPITGVGTVCAGSTTTFYDAVPGGVWSSYSTYIATIGSTTGVLTGVHPGISFVTYALGSCSVTTNDTVTATADSPITGPNTVCVTSTITLSDKTPLGTWSSSTPGVATISSGGVVTGVSAGVTLISYAVSGTCGMAYSTYTVTVVTSVSAGTITGASSVMATFTTPLYDGVSGGTWSSSNPSVATVNTTTGVVTGVAAGTAIITYTVAGCGGSAYTTALMTVNALDIISGTVYFTGASYVGPVKVWLITYNPSTFDLEASDSTTVNCTSGTSVNYQFVGNPTDSFRIKANIYDTSTLIGTTGYIPTYHTSNFYWYAATVLPHVSGTADVSQNITMNTGTITGGSGFIGGNVTTGANKGTASAPAVGLRMYLLSSTGTMMQQTLTDALGNYTFGTLTAGTYTVFPEALNYKTTAYTSITLTSSAMSMSAASFIEHTISKTITPITTGVNNLQSNVSSAFVFPNPSNGKINIQWNVTATEKGTVTISDITGRQVFTSTINMNEGTGISQLDLSGLTNGLYIINVKSNSVNYNNKIEIQK